MFLLTVPGSRCVSPVVAGGMVVLGVGVGIGTHFEQDSSLHLYPVLHLQTVLLVGVQLVLVSKLAEEKTVMV